MKLFCLLIPRWLIARRGNHHPNEERLPLKAALLLLRLIYQPQRSAFEGLQEATLHLPLLQMASQPPDFRHVRKSLARPAGRPSEL